MVYREQHSTHTFSSAGPRPIPDGDRLGTCDPIEVDVAGHLRRIVVAVRIEHPRPGDLVISLQAPSLAEVVLRNQIYGTQADLDLRFDSETDGRLRTLLGQSPTVVQGRWGLVIKDAIAKDEGYLRGWTLTLELLPTG